MKQKLQQLLNKFLSLFPTELPVGLTEFHAWADSVIALAGKYADEDSMKFALASIITSLGPQRSHVAKNFFVRSLRKAAANQVAGQVFYDIKMKQKQAEEAAKQSASNGSKEAELPTT